MWSDYPECVKKGNLAPNLTTISGGNYATGTLTSKQVVVTSTGVIAPSGGTLTINGAVDGTGTIDVGGGDGIVFDGAVNEGQGDGLTIAFTGPGATINLEDPSAFGAVIQGYVAGDTIDLGGITGQPAPTDVQADGDTTFTYANGVTLTWAGSFKDSTVTLIADTPACYCAGTAILTPTGEAAVESLQPGGLVLTVSGQARVIRWIGRRGYQARFMARNPALRPIRFRAGSLGNGLPRRDLLVSSEHAMFLNGLLVPARSLLNGSTIAPDMQCSDVMYYHVELDSHDVILAEGAAAETFLDDDSRGRFHNCSEYVAPGPHVAGGLFCAPRVECGYELEAIRRNLAAVAADLEQRLKPEPQSALSAG